METPMIVFHKRLLMYYGDITLTSQRIMVKCNYISKQPLRRGANVRGLQHV